jgi:dTDP-4-amino-4,6-dideoxyglucose formyltransferase
MACHARSELGGISTLVLCDNAVLLERVMEISRRHAIKSMAFACSHRTSKECQRLAAAMNFPRLNMKAGCQALIEDFDVIISMHCTQIFPAELVTKVRCINFHPGLNPYNRGWYPQVFSILNGQPFGITIHEMDAKIDHGPIIYQEEMPIHCYETSEDVYTKVLQREIELFDDWLEKLVSRDYETTKPSHAGNYNSKRDFEELKAIDLDKPCTPRDFINLLRAMTFRPYQNAYFIDDKTGLKQFVRIEIEPEKATRN